MSRYQVGIIIIVTICILLSLDLYLALDKIPGNTISEKLRAWSYRFTWLPYAIAFSMAVLLTHWFAKPYDKEGNKRTISARLKIAVSLLTVILIGLGVGLFW